MITKHYHRETEVETESPTLEKFLHAYLVTALWSSCDEDGDPFDSKYDLESLAPEALARAKSDCAEFLFANEATIRAAVETGEVVFGPDFDEWGRAGHDFWLTRCRHGAGFWDGDWPRPFATVLTDAAHAFGSVDLYVGDDGEIYDA